MGYRGAGRELDKTIGDLLLAAVLPIGATPADQRFDGLVHRGGDDSRRGGAQRGAGQGHERVGMDAGAEVGKPLGEANRAGRGCLVLAGEAEEEIDVGAEAGGDAVSDRNLDDLGAMAAIRSFQDAVVARLGADHEVVVGDMPLQQGKRFGGAVFGAHFRGEAAEEHPAVRSCRLLGSTRRSSTAPRSGSVVAVP